MSQFLFFLKCPVGCDCPWCVIVIKNRMSQFQRSTFQLCHCKCETILSFLGRIIAPMARAQSMSDLEWTWERFSSEYLGFLLPIIIALIPYTHHLRCTAGFTSRYISTASVISPVLLPLTQCGNYQRHISKRYSWKWAFLYSVQTSFQPHTHTKRFSCFMAGKETKKFLTITISRQNSGFTLLIVLKCFF